MTVAATVSESSPGAIRTYAPIEFLQMLCVSQDSGVLLMSHDEEELGAVEIREGEVWTAFDSLGSGESAFARLIQEPHRGRTWSKDRSQQPRTIEKPFQVLLFEALSAIDEGRAPPPPPTSTQIVEQALRSEKQPLSQLKELNDEARSHLVKKDYRAAADVLTLLSQLDPSSPFARANLNQLRRLGIIQ